MLLFLLTLVIKLTGMDSYCHLTVVMPLPGQTGRWSYNVLNLSVHPSIFMSAPLLPNWQTQYFETE